MHKWIGSVIGLAMLAGSVAPVFAAPNTGVNPSETGPGPTVTTQTASGSFTVPTITTTATAPPVRKVQFTAAQRANLRAKLDDAKGLRSELKTQRNQVLAIVKGNRELKKELRTKLGIDALRQDIKTLRAKGDKAGLKQKVQQLRAIRVKLADFRTSWQDLRNREHAVIVQLKQLRQDAQSARQAARAGFKAGNYGQVVSNANRFIKDESQALTALEDLQSIQQAMHSMLEQAIQKA